ncbi:hypothetical protein QZK42_04565 [Acinetobacter baumannii]|uniref:NACHT domain-containing protein n=3 Tax=Acinetobacter TaxID=469 RepID=UPI0021BF979B|nr:hypothetical protein [Acinetobacter baumannii]MDC4343190.1 hypothetical protein [Acinetobacter baumannii]MDN8303438.1 hypothetical protein [Acinetobacter baumannii]MDN8314055.1 hypothetical protein [Acinetobacter baumannii]MDN8328178.1 hypothetical protein [Acinetobacter baumannii]
MNSEFYLQRKLHDHERDYDELEVIKNFRIIVILAEPGAGKTSLLQSFSNYLNVKKRTANTFSYRNNLEKNSILIIDALDELVRIDQSAVNSLLGKAADLDPSTLIISSRSSEWDESYTRIIKDHFEIEPRILRLFPFNELEQKQIFENYKLEEDFHKFESEVKKYNLEQLLSNPQFLKIFADAYIESNRVFTDRKSIFSQAVKALVKETNIAFNVRNDLPLLRKIECTEEIFAKLLLSGSEGVSTNVDDLDNLYPRIDSLINLDNTDHYTSLLSTRLFKLADNESQHQPSHKIIAEFAAAHYLIRRINANRNSISLSQCLSIIAPNGVVRDELRGLLGWMAALGNKLTQETLIHIDPYAVLANGDPSQLLSSSKKYLLEELINLADIDPYFRRSDMWRNFSVSGFFDDDSILIVKSILVESERGLLRGLILELLENARILESLEPELEKILLDENIDKYIRKLAGLRVSEVINYDIKQSIVRLIEIGTESSLDIAANLIEKIDIISVQYEIILSFLKKCSFLYPSHNEQGIKRIFGKHYFIKSLISLFNYELVINLLDDLSHDLQCICRKEHYECYCRNGVSKIIGTLLDRYFEIEKQSYEANQIWKWLRNLNFHQGKNEKDSIAVKVLQNEDDLRQNIILLAFEGLKSLEEIHRVSWQSLSYYTHSGLSLRLQDHYFILDWAFENNNINLWKYFVSSHQFYSTSRNETNYELRKYAKLQAREKSDFLKAWVKKNLASKEEYKETQALINKRRVKNGKFKRQKIRNENINYIYNNRRLIERGEHWGLLKDFANLTLNQPQRIIEEFGDEELVKTSLRNCLPFIETHVPSLIELSKAQCDSVCYSSEEILNAACLEIFRDSGNLENVKLELLKVLRTNIDSPSYAVDEKEHQAFRQEVDRILFPDSKSRLQFLKDYIEPQLTYNDCKYTQVSWLRYSDTFKEFQDTLPLEWLYKYSDISIETTKTLFDLSAQFCDRNKLKNLIIKRCDELNTLLKKSTIDFESLNSKVMFWFLRAFFFLDESEVVSYWSFLKEQEKTIFLLSDRHEGIRHGDYPFWPALTPTKIGWILDTFIDQWPKVNLPDSWGTGDPPNEIAYRFISNVIWNFTKNISENTLSIVSNLISDSRFEAMLLDLKSIRSTIIRNLALKNFNAPSPEEIVNFLDSDGVITVEGLRSLILEELKIFQLDLDGSETTSKNIFYNLQYKTAKTGEFKRLGEVEATLRVADRLRLRLEHKGITVTPEHQLQNANRCDITFSKIIDNQRKLLVLESKGQWHSELYNAATTQLSERYSIHPHAEQQGIYFVLWFGADEKVANSTKHGVSSAQELKEILDKQLPIELKGLIDIFVLDVSL